MMQGMGDWPDVWKGVFSAANFVIALVYAVMGQRHFSTPQKDQDTLAIHWSYGLFISACGFSHGVMAVSVYAHLLVMLIASHVLTAVVSVGALHVVLMRAR